MKESSIIQAAHQLFIEKGYRDTSITDIVKASGSSKGNLYYHFENKEDLFLSLIKEEEKKWDNEWKTKQRQFNTAREKMLGIANFSADMDANFPLRRAIAEFYAKNHHSKDIENHIKELNYRYLLYYEDILNDGNLNDEWNVSDVKMTSFIAGALFSGLEMYTYDVTIERRKELYRHSAEIFLDGL
ncbi:TetR/AcrR family transcriptional regulator [Salicibibacter cibarius]|nr:TetR/AcrR family transcriptional regulator [Salicibibacter cibarius]